MAQYIVNDTELTAVANAIRTKGGTSEALEFPQGFVDAVDDIPSGGSAVSVPSKDVDFYDYDGTRVYSYTASEFAELTSMPAAPDHSTDEVPLTSQGWNWSLSDAKTYVASYGMLDIGHTYIPTDGKTHIFVNVNGDKEIIKNREFGLYFAQSANNAVTINWGDGSSPQTYSGTSSVDHTHKYSSSGKYHITLTVASGKSITITSTSTSSISIYGSNNDSITAYKRKWIEKVYIGSRVNISGSSEFNCCYGLISITLPNGITSFPKSFLRSCSSLTSITIPSTVTSIGDYAFYDSNLLSICMPKSLTNISLDAFQNCYYIKRVTIPSNVTSIGEYAFASNFNLTSLVIPNGVNTIGSSALNNCYGLTSITIPSSVTSIASSGISSGSITDYHFKGTTPPTVSSSTGFMPNPTYYTYIIYVPRSENQAVLNAYKTATNWSTYASYMQEEPE